jgi:hypothetical protein
LGRNLADHGAQRVQPSQGWFSVAVFSGGYSQS